MPTLINAVEKLTSFSKTEGVVEVIRDLNALIISTRSKESLALSNINSQKIFEQLRRQLNQLMSKSDTPLANAAHFSLLALAEFKPLNENDCFTMMKNERDDDSVFVSTGHQYSLTSLINYHNSRPARPSEINGKRLFNIAANVHFNFHDTRHILSVAKQKGVAIHALEDKDTTSLWINVGAASLAMASLYCIYIGVTDPSENKPCRDIPWHFFIPRAGVDSLPKLVFEGASRLLFGG